MAELVTFRDRQADEIRAQAGIEVTRRDFRHMPSVHLGPGGLEDRPPLVDFAKPEAGECLGRGCWRSVSNSDHPFCCSKSLPTAKSIWYIFGAELGG